MVHRHKTSMRDVRMYALSEPKTCKHAGRREGTTRHIGTHTHTESMFTSRVCCFMSTRSHQRERERERDRHTYTESKRERQSETQEAEGGHNHASNPANSWRREQETHDVSAAIDSVVSKSAWVERKPSIVCRPRLLFFCVSRPKRSWQHPDKKGDR